MGDSSFASQMLTIGASSTFDATKLSNSTLRSVASHIRTLKRNGIPMTEESLTLNTIYMLDRLVDVHGKLLNDQYKRQIGLTIKRMYPNAEISLEPYRTSRHRSSQTRMASEKFVSDIRKIRDETLNILETVEKRGEISDLGQYDTCLAILLTICTSLRINEILQLKLAHISKILANEPIGIKSKASNNVRYIAPNDLLINTFKTVQRQRTYVKANIEHKKLDHASRYQILRFDNGSIIISSEDHMRKKLHEISASLGIRTAILGFNVFRKHVTSILTQGGGHFVAQAMNNHSSVNTTLDHYNVVTPQAAQMTFDALVGKFNELDPPEIDVRKMNPDIMMADDKTFKLRPNKQNNTVPSPMPSPAPSTVVDYKPNLRLDTIVEEAVEALPSPQVPITVTLPSTLTETETAETTPQTSESDLKLLNPQQSTINYNILNSLFDTELSNLRQTYTNSDANIAKLMAQLKDGWTLEDLKVIMKFLNDSVSHERRVAQKITQDLKDQMLNAQSSNQTFILTMLANHKKTLDRLILQNNSTKRNTFKRIEALNQQYTKASVMPTPSTLPFMTPQQTPRQGPPPSYWTPMPSPAYPNNASNLPFETPPYFNEDSSYQKLPTTSTAQRR